MMNDECVFVDFGSTQEHQVGFGIYLNRKSNFNYCFKWHSRCIKWLYNDMLIETTSNRSIQANMRFPSTSKVEYLPKGEHHVDIQEHPGVSMCHTWFDSLPSSRDSNLLQWDISEKIHINRGFWAPTHIWWPHLQTLAMHSHLSGHPFEFLLVRVIPGPTTDGQIDNTSGYDEYTMES